MQDFANEHLLRTGRRFFLVVQDGHLLGLITPNEVRTVETRAWPFTPVRSVMRSADKVDYVSRDMPAMEALEAMGGEDVNQLPVISDGRVEGIVSRAHVLQVLRSRTEPSTLHTLNGLFSSAFLFDDFIDKVGFSGNSSTRGSARPAIAGMLLHHLLYRR